jgi:hypothetical protein
LDHSQAWKIEMNVDGAFEAVDKFGGWGFVIWNHDGTGLNAEAGSLPSTYNALCAKAEACFAGLQTVITHGISYVYIETDSLMPVTTLKSSRLLTLLQVMSYLGSYVYLYVLIYSCKYFILAPGM